MMVNAGIDGEAGSSSDLKRVNDVDDVEETLIGSMKESDGVRRSDCEILDPGHAWGCKHRVHEQVERGPCVSYPGQRRL